MYDRLIGVFCLFLYDREEYVIFFYDREKYVIFFLCCFFNKEVYLYDF